MNTELKIAFELSLLTEKNTQNARQSDFNGRRMYSTLFHRLCLVFLLALVCFSVFLSRFHFVAVHTADARYLLLASRSVNERRVMRLCKCQCSIH